MNETEKATAQWIDAVLPTLAPSKARIFAVGSDRCMLEVTVLVEWPQRPA